MNARTKTKPTVAVDDVAMPPSNLPAVQEAVALPAQPPAAAPKPAPVERKVYPASIAKAILSVTREIGQIHKASKNTFQNYTYASWQDVNERLSPLLAEHGLMIMQSEISRNLIEENEKGSTLAIVYEFTIVNEAGDQWPPISWTATSRLRDGKGVTDDKAAPKCATQAEKYFCVKTFKIRMTDAIDNDADDARGGGRSAAPVRESRMALDKLIGEVANHLTSDELTAWMHASDATIADLPTSQKAELRLVCSKRLGELRTLEQFAAQKSTPEWSNREVDPEAPEPQPVTEADQWSALTPTKQAGILCGDPMFQAFLREVHDADYDPATFVRSHCLVASRKDIRNNHPSGKLWRELVAEYRAWQHRPPEPDGLDEVLPPLPSPRPTPPGHPAADPAASSSHPAAAEAVGGVPSAEEYERRWDGIIEAATNAQQLGKTWAGQKDQRAQIDWPEGALARIKGKVERALEFLKEPTRG